MMNSPFPGQPPIKLPYQLKLINALGPALKTLGLFNVYEDPEYYFRKARKQTKLTDFGTYDLEKPLKHLLPMLKNEGDLSLFGRITIYQLIHESLVNNLLMQEDFATTPELGNVDVEDPIIVVCTPRTGSTLLHNLLSLHEESRSPRMWELCRPSPPPKPELETTDPRIKQSDSEVGMYYRLVPEMKAIHYFGPEAIEECTHLFANIFSCRFSFSTMVNSNSYMDWVMQDDMVEAYRSYKKHLQLLKFNYRKKILVLKSPAHIMSLDALSKVFPKARIVHLHRDPATAAASCCSLAEAVQIPLRKNIDPHAIGEMWNKYWTPALLDSIKWRENTDLNVIDINYQDLMQDPAGEVSKIYRHFGLDIPETLPSRVNQYLANHPKNEFGKHEYSLERYGLNSDELYQQYADYIKYFDVPLDKKNQRQDTLNNIEEILAEPTAV